MSVNVFYEGIALARDVVPTGEDGGCFVPVAAPMPVGTRLAVERGGERLAARVSHVVETGEPGIFLVGESGEPLRLDDAPAPTAVAPAPAVIEAAPAVVEAAPAVVEAAPAPAPVEEPEAKRVVEVGPPPTAPSPVVVVEAPPLPEGAAAATVTAEDREEGAAPSDSGTNGEAGDKNGKGGAKRRAKKRR